MVQAMTTNWKTTALGVCAILSALGFLGTDVLSGNFATIAEHLPALMAGIGLLFSKDSH